MTQHEAEILPFVSVTQRAVYQAELFDLEDDVKPKLERIEELKGILGSIALHGVRE